MQDWIQKIKTNENAALREIYYLCKEDCITWLEHDFGLMTDDALDVFQMSVVIMYDNVVTGQLVTLTSHIKTYLKGIARNKALELLRSRKNILSAADSLSVMAQYVSEENDDTILDKQLTAALVSHEVIGDPCKSLLQLYYYNDMNVEDITALLGYKNADTTKNQKYKCLKRLQNIYFGHIQKSLEY